MAMHHIVHSFLGACCRRCPIEGGPSRRRHCTIYHLHTAWGRPVGSKLSFETQCAVRVAFLTVFLNSLAPSSSPSL